ncbi:MAG: DNA polymerase III subunit gamma/tau [Spirochaetaceae bacterium]|jgi:DNA polymerase-3 subunit gamma/tau|nr:DNA polymerase III subunit gamma/tau [Spirochaetaceae bacterium]
MAYEVTATRRRPKTFDELVGQEFVSATLKSSIKSGQIAHAFLFSGPRGCGKTSAARILARSLNCEKGPTVNPCGVCASCREIGRGASLDIIEIDGASNTSVNDVRQIKDEVLFPPNAGRYKVYIIDEVHMLSTNAFNALLKTIEEPPPYIVFIFATTELHKVPATIKSRCQQFAFRLISPETITAVLRDTCTEMGITAEDEALFRIAKESTGSLRDAYTLFDQVVSFSAGNIRAALIREKLGLVGLESLNALAEACAANDTATAFALIDRIIDGGVAIEQFVIDMAGYYRSLLLLKNGVTRESLLGYSSDRFSGSVLERLDSLHLERALDLLLDLYRNIRYSVSPRFELESVVSKLSWLSLWISPPELREEIARVRAVLGPAAMRPGIPDETGAGTSGTENTVKLAVKEAGEGPEDTAAYASEHAGSEQEIFDSPLQFGKPGTFTEEFKRRMAAREAVPKAKAGEGDEDPDIPPQAEMVRRVFHGTVVRKK